jgi:hypothetical protein
VEPAPRSLVGRPPDDGADRRPLHGDAAQHGHVAGTRDVAGDVEAVRANEVRVAQSERPGLGVHEPDEALDAAAADVRRERVRGVVRTLDQRGLDEIADGDALALAQVDRRFAHPRGRHINGDHVVQPYALERHEDGHQLGDARDRHPLAGAVLEQHLAGRSVLHEPRAGFGAGCRRRRRGGEGSGCDGEGEDEQAPLQQVQPTGVNAPGSVGRS